MSLLDAPEPDCPQADDLPLVETRIVPRARDLGGFEVRRILPAPRRHMVGPFIFLDQMGPADFDPGRGIDVRPHPHIGLATVTYLFEGEILHRDSLGSLQPIRPGALNWMSAGRGIAHSERTDQALRHHGNRMFGMQAWVALPARHEESDPSFAHTPAEALPGVEGEGASVRVIAGRLFGAASPAATLSDLFYADVQLDAGARLAVPAEHAERGAYLVEGRLRAGGERFDEPQLLVFRRGAEIVLEAETPVRLMLLGGEPFPEERHIWWNFVSSSRERIEQAKADWRAGRFPAVPGESEFIPLPEG